MRLKLYYIAKRRQEDEYTKLLSHVVSLQENAIFSKDIAQAQQRGASFARASYSKAYAPFLAQNDYKIALDERGKLMDSRAYAALIANKSDLSLFFGGAYGLEEDFKASCDLVLSLSPLTFAHKLAIMLAKEQCYRAFCINAKHPYHKDSHETR